MDLRDLDLGPQTTVRSVDGVGQPTAGREVLVYVRLPGLRCLVRAVSAGRVLRLCCVEICTFASFFFSEVTFERWIYANHGLLKWER